jgi:hypothetical protein
LALAIERNEAGEPFSTACKEMELTVKQLKWSDRVSYLIAIPRGEIDAEAFKEIFNKITATAASLINCRVWIWKRRASAWRPQKFTRLLPSCRLV